MSQAEVDCAYTWLKQREVIKAYVFLLELDQKQLRTMDTVRQTQLAHLVKVLNALILARWSDSGLRQIKKAAWRIYETDYKLAHEGRTP